MIDKFSYGTTRKRREEVTYAQIERAATDILKTGARPTLEGVRKVLGGGSPRTILNGLNQYWRDLGNQVAGTPDTLRRLPAAVADLAEGLWHRALSVAVGAAQATQSDAEGQLSRLKSQLELRSHTLSKREVELDELVRSRERTVKELEGHLRAALSMLARKDATIAGLESSLAAARQETDDHRQRLARVVRRIVTKHRDASPERPSKSTQTDTRPFRRSAKKGSSKRRGKRR
jgi:uncharacterized coiled-coil protein SlyX